MLGWSERRGRMVTVGVDGGSDGAPPRSREHQGALQRPGLTVDPDRTAEVHGRVRPRSGHAPARRALHREIAAVRARILRRVVLPQAGAEHDRAIDRLDVVRRAAQPQTPPMTVRVHLDLDALTLVEDVEGPGRLVRVDLDLLPAELEDHGDLLRTGSVPSRIAQGRHAGVTSGRELG